MGSEMCIRDRFACVLIAPAAHAQTTVDVGKITCDQFLMHRISNPNNIALWISGYYNGQHGNTTLDVQGMQDHVEKLKDYCATNSAMPVMRAVETLVSGKK